MMRYLVLSAVLAVAGCTADATDEPAASACRGDLPVGNVTDFAVIGNTNEGIAFGPEGRMYVSGNNNGTVYVVTADGTVSIFATAPSTLGLAFVGDDLFVAGFGSDEVYKIGKTGGAAEVYATAVTKANFVTPTPWGTLLVSNDFASKISEVTATGATTWSDVIYSPNGMAFTPDGATLYVVTTFADSPGLWRLPVAGKTPGTPSKIIDFAPGDTPDGLALADDGSVVVALNVGGKLARVDPAAGKVVQLVEGVRFPASLAFGRGGFDPCSAYATQLFDKKVSRVVLGVTGK